MKKIKTVIKNYLYTGTGDHSGADLDITAADIEYFDCAAFSRCILSFTDKDHRHKIK